VLEVGVSQRMLKENDAEVQNNWRKDISGNQAEPANPRLLGKCPLDQ